jgi:fatty acid desaturase
VCRRLVEVIHARRSPSRIARKKLSTQSYRSIPRIFLDLRLWAGAAGLAIYVHRWWVTVISVFLIGFGPFHDLLVQGHEGTHDLISRNRRVNDLFTWFTLSLAGISAEAHRRGGALSQPPRGNVGSLVGPFYPDFEVCTACECFKMEL